MLVKIEFFENAGKNYGGIDINQLMVKFVHIEDIDSFYPSRDGYGVVYMKDGRQHILSAQSSDKLKIYLTKLALAAIQGVDA